MLLCLSITSVAYAFLCSTAKGSGYINIGFSTAQVQAICGAPDTINQTKTPPTQTVNVQNWTYAHALVQPYSNPTTPQPINAATRNKPNVTFEVVNNVVSTITVQGQSLPSSNLCRGGMLVKVGDNSQAVLQGCGKPDFTSNTTKTINVAPQNITVWTYNNPNPNGIPLVLQFTNDQLSKLPGK